MTARGAADFLTRTTAVLGGLFVVLSIVLAAYAGVARRPAQIDTSLANQAAPARQLPPIQPGAPLVDPNAPPAGQPAQNQPAGNQAAPSVPLAE